MKKVGLALGSGGARGYAHIGIIKVLNENNIPIDYIAGSSIGAVVGAYYALNLEVAGLEKIGLEFKRRDVLSLVDLNDPRVSIIKGKKVRGFLEKIFGDKTFQDTKIPMKISGTALEDGSLVVFDSGKIIDAVMASGAFPGVFPAIEYHGKHIVDGGLADGLPLDLVRDMGAQIIIGVDLFSFDLSEIKEYKMKQVLERTYKLLISKLSTYKEQEYGSNLIVLKPKIGDGFDTFAFDNAKPKILAGEEVARSALPKIKNLIK